MIRIFSLPYKMTWAAYKNDHTRLEETVLVTQMMCVHAGTATEFAHAAFTVVDEPADLLPPGSIHKFFVVHRSIYAVHCGFRRVAHDFLEVSWGCWDRPLLVRLDGYEFLEGALSTTGATVSSSCISGATLAMATFICARKLAEDAKVGFR